MLRNAKALEGLELHATDGKIGHVRDFFFDDEHWGVRYLVVDTGGWLAGRRVLISPAAVVDRDWSGSVLPVNLTTEQVRNSPGVEVEQPVSREDELALTQYYAWPSYWTMSGMADGNLGMSVPPPIVDPDAVVPLREARVARSAVAEHHLRSVTSVRGFQIEARDGALGSVSDFVLDDERWTIRFLVVDTGKIWPVRKVLVPPRWIDAVGWNRESVRVNLARETIRTSPACEAQEIVGSDYAAKLEAHYRAREEAERAQR